MVLNCNNKILDISEPKVMGILNLTPDSFYDGNAHVSLDKMKGHIDQMLLDGVDIIDLGAVSSRPGAINVPVEEEQSRLVPALEYLRKLGNTEVFISVDTYRSEIIEWAVDHGAHILNDISAGTFDPDLFSMAGKLQIPYILMHMQGRPENMQNAPTYEDVTMEVLTFFVRKIAELKRHGVRDIIIDMGFGFGKTLEHNYELLHKMSCFKILDTPILTGISRKSMIYKLLDITPDEALNGTSALHMLALLNGSNILRVHDVKEAKECIKLYQKFKNPLN